MKKLLIILVLIMKGSYIYSQVNLVPNPSFEDTVFCPFATTQIQAAKHWMSFGNTPDYWNSCATSGMNVPNSIFGFQNAHTGEGRAGFVAYRVLNIGLCSPNCREYLGVQLLSSLQIGTEYFISMFINYSFFHPLTATACNKMGIRFSTIPFDQNNLPHLNNTAHLFTDDIISDTVAWISVEGSFIADSSYNYLCIGNFFDDNHTDTLMLTSQADVAYYYVDDICVSTDSTLCRETTNKISMPNVFTPNGDFVNDKFLPIENKNIISGEMRIFNRWGEIVFETTDINLGWDGGNETSAVYFWVIEYLHNSQIQRGNGYVTLIR